MGFQRTAFASAWCYANNPVRSRPIAKWQADLSQAEGLRLLTRHGLAGRRFCRQQLASVVTSGTSAQAHHFAEAEGRLLSSKRASSR